MQKDCPLPHQAQHPARRLAAALGLAALLWAPAPTTRASDVTLEVHVVRASGKLSADTAPSVAEDLAKVRIPWSHFGYGRYELAQVVRRGAAWDQSVAVTYAGKGRFTLTPHRGDGEAAAFSLHVEQRLPAADEPCLVTDAAVEPGQRSLQYCAVEIDGATWLFVVAAATE